MKRVLPIALCLFALTAIAAEPQPNGTNEPVCDKAEPASEPARSDGARTSVKAAPVPARASSPTRTTPRWNSLLPGMFR